MPTITVKLSDDIYARLCQKAARRQISPDELACEIFHTQFRKELLQAAGVGHSGHIDTSERIEELFRAES